MRQMTEEVELLEGGQLWTDLAAILDLLATSPAEAEEHARAILKALPGQSNALQILIQALRLQGDVIRARAELESMSAEFPNLAILHFELGQLLSELGEREGAIREFSRTVELEPRHPAAWRTLADELAGAGNVEAAANAFAKQFDSSVVDLKMLETMFARAGGRDEAAANLVREYLKVYSTDVFAVHLMGRMYMQANLFAPAEQLFAHALDLAPDFADARSDYIAVLHQQHKWQAAIAELDKCLEEDPEQPDLVLMKAIATFQLNDYAASLALFDRLLRDHPGVAQYWGGYASVLRGAGRRDESIAAYRRSLELRPELGAAWWGLAEQIASQFTPSELSTLRAQISRTDLGDEDRCYIHFALGEVLEATQAYEESFRHYADGNAIRRKQLPYVAEEITAKIKRAKTIFGHEFFEGRKGRGCDAKDPIFIIGLPRSGSTLVEQILSSHDLVEGTGELPSLTLIAGRLEITDAGQEASGGSAVPTLADADLRALGQEYLDTSRIYRKLARPYFTDKAPNNFHHLALICAALPNAKIIDVRRHPMACCFSNYKQLFPWGYPQTYDLADIGQYYWNYVELMAHFDEVLPGRVLRVFYEDLVRDTEREARRIFEHCGLDFEPKSLRFYENQRIVMTVSAEQVRRPIYEDANKQWRHYERWLDPLKQVLGALPHIYPAVPERFE